MFKKGCIPWNKGVARTDECKEKLQKANVGKHFSASTEFKKGDTAWNKGIPQTKQAKENISRSLKGKPLTEKHKKNISKSQMGRIPWNKGKKHSEEHIRRAADARRGTKLTQKEKDKKWPTYLRGKDNPNWKGGITTLRNQIRHCPKYKQWISDVFQQDNWTCQTCGDRNGMGHNVYLEAHHIKPFAQILVENQIKSVPQAMECKEFWDVDNGVTLCRDCHDLTKANSQLQMLEK